MNIGGVWTSACAGAVRPADRRPRAKQPGGQARGQGHWHRRDQRLGADGRGGRLLARVGWQKACVAIVNKNARILWAVTTREQGFDAHHVSVKPQAKGSPAKSTRPTETGQPVACAA